MNKDILHKSIDLLSRREHSIKELKQKLLARAFEGDEIDVVSTYLIENDYLSNERFAESVVRNKISRGYGYKYIENELKQKGVDGYVISQAIKEQNVDWYLQAGLAYNKRFGESPIYDHKDKAKRIRFLQYRGFSYEEINTVLQTD